MAADLRRTPLFEVHRSAGAKMVPFAGWEMPVEYDSIRLEHLAVRNRAGVFDVSHMGEIETTGESAAAFLDRLLTNDISRIDGGGAQYSLMCNEEGGVLDDLFTYRFPAADESEHFLTVVNASNADSDFDWFTRQAERFDGASVANRSSDYAMLALQGPDAIAILEPLLEEAPPPRFRFTEATVAQKRALVCRTGYTGEDGVELLIAPEDATDVWRAVTDGGAVPAGLGARDTLRLEVCYPLYGNDLTTERTPIEAGLKWACALGKDFIGVERLRELTENGTAEQLVPFRFIDPGIPRPGCAVLQGDEQIGVVTSGTLSPCLEVGVGMAYVRSDLAAPGTELEVDVRGKRRKACVESKPLYKKAKGD